MSKARGGLGAEKRWQTKKESKEQEAFEADGKTRVASKHAEPRREAGQTITDLTSQIC